MPRRWPPSLRLLNGASLFVIGERPLSKGAQPVGDWFNHAPCGIYPFRTCLIFNRGLSVLSTFQPRQGSSVLTERRHDESRGERCEAMNNWTPKGLAFWVGWGLWIVGLWLGISNRFPGASSARHPLTSCRRGGVWVSSSWGVYRTDPSTPSRAARASALDRALGNSVGAIGWSREPALHRDGPSGAELGSVLAPTT